MTGCTPEIGTPRLLTPLKSTRSHSPQLENHSQTYALTMVSTATYIHIAFLRNINNTDSQALHLCVLSLMTFRKKIWDGECLEGESLGTKLKSTH